MPEFRADLSRGIEEIKTEIKRYLSEPEHVYHPLRLAEVIDTIRRSHYLDINQKSSLCEYLTKLLDTEEAEENFPEAV